MSAIIEFLEGRGPDASGRTLETVLAFDPSSLERHHDFIQWLFPLTEPSCAVPGSPTLTPTDVVYLQGSEAAQINVARSAILIGRFYDFSADWLRPSDA